jgi:hypothetical protein
MPELVSLQKKNYDFAVVGALDANGVAYGSDFGATGSQLLPFIAQSGPSVLHLPESFVLARSLGIPFAHPDWLLTWQ